MAKHNPEPWLLQMPEHGVLHIRDAQGERIFLDIDCRPGSQEEATARLFYAAPDLLRALEALLALPTSQDSLEILDRGMGGNTVWGQSFLSAREAVRKAKGEVG